MVPIRTSGGKTGASLLGQHSEKHMYGCSRAADALGRAVMALLVRAGSNASAARADTIPVWSLRQLRRPPRWRWSRPEAHPRGVQAESREGAGGYPSPARESENRPGRAGAARPPRRTARSGSHARRSRSQCHRFEQPARPPAGPRDLSGERSPPPSDRTVSGRGGERGAQPVNPEARRWMEDSRPRRLQRTSTWPDADPESRSMEPWSCRRSRPPHRPISNRLPRGPGPSRFGRVAQTVWRGESGR